LRKICLLKHVTEEKIEERLEVTGRRERRRKQLLDDLKGKKLKQEALDHSQWRARFGWDYGPVFKTEYEVKE
jgi:hypothetical protein